MRFPKESLHTETGPGVIEAAIEKSYASEARNRAALFKTFTKIHAQQNNLMATFMARWSQNYPDQ